MSDQRIGFLISLSGFDGAGKSTQVKLLSEYLRKKKKKVLVTEIMFGYFLLKLLVRFLRSTTSSLPGGPIKRNKSFLPKLWFIFAFVDIWVMYIFKIIPMKERYDFIIADRFYTDIWANLVYYGYIPDFAFNFFVKLLPKADMAFMLMIEPETVLRREKEFPSTYYKEQARIYKNLSNQINFILIKADQDPKEVFMDIKKLVG